MAVNISGKFAVWFFILNYMIYVPHQIRCTLPLRFKAELWKYWIGNNSGTNIYFYTFAAFAESVIRFFSFLTALFWGRFFEFNCPYHSILIYGIIWPLHLSPHIVMGKISFRFDNYITTIKQSVLILNSLLLFSIRWKKTFSDTIYI